MTERLLAALTDNGKWLEALPALDMSPRSGNTAIASRRTIWRRCGKRGSPGFLLWRTACWTLGGPVEAGPLLEPHNVRGETKQVVVGYLTPMLMADRELRPFAGVCGTLEPALAQGCLSCRRV